MSTPIPPAKSVPTYVADGARIASILVAWGFLAWVASDVVPELGLPVGSLGADLGALFALTGVLNALLYLLYRATDYWHASA